MTPDQNAKLDYLCRFVRKLELAFAPPLAVVKEEETKAMSDRLAEVMAEEPSPEDLMFWSLPGPLPSEVRAAEATEGKE